MEHIKKELNKEQHKQQTHITKWTEEPNKKEKNDTKTTKNNKKSNSEQKWTI